MEDLKDLKPQQSIELLKALHILTRDARMNQDSRRKLKQVYHLMQKSEWAKKNTSALQNISAPSRRHSQTTSYDDYGCA